MKKFFYFAKDAFFDTFEFMRFATAIAIASILVVAGLTIAIGAILFVGECVYKEAGSILAFLSCIGVMFVEAYICRLAYLLFLYK